MRKLPALLTLGALAFAGCGSGPSYVRDQDATLRLTLDEYRLRPENITVRAGRVHLVARNVGRLTHNVAVEEWEPADEDAEPREYARTDTAHPGETVSERGELRLKPGKYRILCTIGNHDDLGQYGELKVTAK
ncbi:MAG: hypothetical protein HZB46_05750 [Solirubrobacterales bacterium]|nr:hypothetical protein [Solirubrobacterales bacterium]